MKRNLPTSSIDALIMIRDKRIHTSAIMLLRIVDHLEQYDKNNHASIGGVLGFYKEHRRNSSGLINYTYGGVASMLRVMSKKGLLLPVQDGRCRAYKLSKTGIAVLDGMYI